MSSLRTLLRPGLQLRQLCIARAAISQQSIMSRRNFKQPGRQYRGGARNFSTTGGRREQNYRHEDAYNAPRDVVYDCNYVKLNGLPFRATKQDILEFLEGVEVEGGENGIYGEYDGTAFVKMASREDVMKALKRDRQTMTIGDRSRYIEVYQMEDDKKVEQYKAVEESLGVDTSDNASDRDMYFKLANLPYGTTKDEVMNFIEGIEVEQDTPIAELMDGKDGTAFVKVKSEEDAEKLFQKKFQLLRGRPVKIFQTSYRSLVAHKMAWKVQENGYFVKLQGLPHGATVRDICDFLGGDVTLQDGTRSVRLNWSEHLTVVEVASEQDLEAALSRNKHYMGDRYIDVAPFKGNPGFRPSNSRGRRPPQRPQWSDDDSY